MAFQKEHDLASEYFSSMDSNLYCHHLVGTLDIWYYISLKKNDKNFDSDEEKKKFEKLFNKFNLASEGLEPFKYKIVKATSWSDYDFELVIFSKRSLNYIINNL